MYQRTIEELQKDEREKVIIDIRREADFLRETYPGAKHIYWEEFEAHKDEVPKDCPVYLICYTGATIPAADMELTDAVLLRSAASANTATASTKPGRPST